MTILEAIARIDTLKPNGYRQSEKISWLSELDGMIMTEIMSGYENTPVSFSGYDTDTPTDTVLLVPPPYDAIYLYWLETKIHYYDAEYTKYNTAMAMYNHAWESFAAYYGRHHLKRRGRFLF